MAPLNDSIWFFTIVGTDLIQSHCSNGRNRQPVNLLQLLCITCAGHRYCVSQQFENCWEIFALVLSSICCISSKFVTESIKVKGLNSNGVSLMMICYGPIRSTAASLHRSIFKFCFSCTQICIASVLILHYRDNYLHICICYNLSDNDDKISLLCYIPISFLQGVFSSKWYHWMASKISRLGRHIFQFISSVLLDVLIRHSILIMLISLLITYVSGFSNAALIRSASNCWWL